jgi:hypothetical protein
VRRVSYQSMLGSEGGPATAVYVRLGEGSIGTRRKDARKDVTVALSKAQRRWLRDAVELSGPDIDEGSVLRAMVDLGMELEIDWAVIARGKALRAAVRDSVMVLRGAAG